MRRFRVLLVVPLAGIGGTELSTLALATGLKDAGHHVYVMYNAHPLVNEFIERGLEVVPAGMQRNLRGLIKDARIMRHCIAKNEIEIVHFQSAFPMIMLLLSVRSIRSDGIKVIWTCRGINRISYFIGGRLFNFLTDFVIANCDAERQKLIGHGLSPDKVKTVYNCPTIAMPEDISKNLELQKELGIAHDTPVVGTASRLSPDRGVEYFLGAASVIAQQMPEVRFVIAGGGALAKDLRRQASKLDIENKVVFMGTRRDMNKVYSIMDVFVNPALVRAGTDNVNIEAMAFAKPVIVTKVGGGLEVVQDGFTGLVVPPRDSRALAQATLRLLKDKDLARRMGMAGRERVMRDFSKEKLVSEIGQVYQQVSID